MPRFNAKTAFVNPIDDININRIFPGQRVSPLYYGPGTVSHHMVNFIYENIMKRATHFVDLHGCDLQSYARASPSQRRRETTRRT